MVGKLQRQRGVALFCRNGIGRKPNGEGGPAVLPFRPGTLGTRYSALGNRHSAIGTRHSACVTC